MIKSGSVIILAGILEMIFAPPPENIPKMCTNMNNEAIPNCCVFPPLFTMKDMYKCGFPEQESLIKKRPSSRDCPKYKCLAKKNNWLREGELDPELISAFLDKYTKKHQSMTSAVAAAKKKCVGRQLIGMESCPPEKILACIATVTFFECPGWQTDPRCDFVKDYMKTCPKYFLNF